MWCVTVMQKAKSTEKQNIQFAKFSQENNHDRALTLLHFKAEGVCVRKINHVIKRFLDTGDMRHNTKSGSKSTACSNKMAEKTRKLFVKEPNLSTRQAALKLNISQGS